MRASPPNHVSVVAHDIEVSRRFYVEELGLEPLPTPDFGFPVVWLHAGDCQVHLFERPGEPPSHAHFGARDRRFHARLPTHEGARRTRPRDLRKRDVRATGRRNPDVRARPGREPRSSSTIATHPRSRTTRCRSTRGSPMRSPQEVRAAPRCDPLARGQRRNDGSARPQPGASASVPQTLMPSSGLCALVRLLRLRLAIGDTLRGGRLDLGERRSRGLPGSRITIRSPAFEPGGVDHGRDAVRPVEEHRVAVGRERLPGRRWPIMSRSARRLPPLTSIVTLPLASVETSVPRKR